MGNFEDASLVAVVTTFWQNLVICQRQLLQDHWECCRVSKYICKPPGHEREETQRPMGRDKLSEQGFPQEV